MVRIRLLKNNCKSTYHEYVVPKSIPMTVPMSFLSSLDETAITARATMPTNAVSNLIFNLDNT